MIPISSLPTLNAILNSLSAMFLVTGYLMIRRKNVALHRICMIAAFITSVLFLISYLTYHAAHPGMTRFPDIPIVRTVYLSILLTHTILAALGAFSRHHYAKICVETKMGATPQNRKMDTSDLAVCFHYRCHHLPDALSPL